MTNHLFSLLPIESVSEKKKRTYIYTKNEHLACVGYIWFGTATNHVWGGSSFTNNAQELSNTQQSDNISPLPLTWGT